MEDIVKKQIGDYELLAVIGDGAQGRVYKACALSDTASGLSKGSLVALKVVNIAGEDEDMRRKFQQQSEILRRLSHNSIVKYIDSFVWRGGELDECQCLVMEYLEGEDLTCRVKNFPAGLAWPQVEDIFEKCLAGLIHARQCGITHRDLKPSNIYLTKDGQVKLIDFDIARKDDSEQLSTAGWKGTFDYMAPDFITREGFRGDEISDVFSLGVCFYQALTGSLPYEPLGSNAHIGYVNRWHGGTIKPPSFRLGVFRVLAGAKEFVAKAISVRREERYQSFTEMLEDFRKIHYRVVRHKGKEDYELLSLLGRGGFGEVFKARCASDGSLVAVKHLFSEKQSDRFIKEAKILQRYNHENLVRYVDFMQQETNTGNKQFFLVMEYLEGMPGWTLRLRIKNEGRLGVDETLKLFKVYLSALHFMHSHARPIIHRDIKPGNLYAPLGRPEKGKIFDMGVARDVSGTVTTGGVPGTLDYMAPEFADATGDRGSPQSDIYALGLCFYEALTGNPVYERLPQDINSAWSGFIARVKTTPAICFDDPIFSEYPRLAGIVAKSLALNPSDRYASAQAMVDDLDAALTPPTQSSRSDDLFDDSELTMATSPGGGAATLGTRPMDGDINDYLKKIGAEKKKKGGKNLSKSTLIMRLAIAVLGVAVAGGALWMGVAVITGKGKKTIGDERPAAVATDVKPSVNTPEPPPAEEPEPPPAGTPEAKPELQPETPVKKEPVQVSAVESPPKTVVVAAADYPDAQVVQGLIAEKLSDEKSVANAHQAMVLLVDAEKKKWQSVPVDEKRKFIADTRAEITEKFSAYIKLTADRVVELAATGKDAESVYQPLLGLKESAPLLVAYCSQAYQEGCAAADSAIKVKKIDAAMAELTANAANAGDVPALNEQVAKYRQLAALPDVVIGQPQSTQFEKAIAARYAALAESQYLEFKKACDSNNLPRASEMEKEFLRWAATVTPEFGKAQLLETAKTFASDYKQAVARQAQSIAKKDDAAEVALPGKDTPDPLPAKVEAQPPAVVEHTKSYLEISVSPANATLQVDGRTVEAGKIEVEPEKNHRIEVSCPGYKSVKQFYKVSSGDTRKVDVLLQKGSSRSIFGF
ncbi:MAG: serine/threonine-protein kinase [Kiritimatiellae bacterium]|nr:serine/threonine-protein kinase [Kiritimatiellia bacterium]